MDTSAPPNLSQLCSRLRAVPRQKPLFWHTNSDCYPQPCIAAKLSSRRGISIRPRCFAALNAPRNLGLEIRRPECIPLVVDLVDQTSAALGVELHQPIKRFLLWPRSGCHRNVDRQAAPDEIRREQDQIGFVGSHPIRKRASRSKPATDELAARMLGTVLVDRATPVNAKRTRLSWMHLMAADFDAKPAIAASRAIATASYLS